MASRNVQFNFGASVLTPGPTVAATDHMVLIISDHLNQAVFTSPNQPATATTLTVSLPTQQDYTAWLKSYAADGTVNSGASSGVPHQAFTVTDSPPPPAVPPGDPTLSVPVLL